MSGKDIVFSTFASLVVVSLVGFVALPALYPTLQTNDTKEDLGLVIQSKYLEVSSTAGITDDNVGSFVKVPDTSLNMSISANSRISATFTSPFIFGIGPNVTNKRFLFNVSLEVETVGNETITLSSWNSGTTTSYFEYSSTMYIHYLSPKLSAGNYTINVKYVSSHQESPQLAYLTLCTNKINQTRSLWVLEMR